MLGSKALLLSQQTACPFGIGWFVELQVTSAIASSCAPRLSLSAAHTRRLILEDT